MVTGVMAPIRVKGVTMGAWPPRTISVRPPIISTSTRRGEFTLITVMMAGSPSSCSGARPRAMAAMAMVSTMRWRPMPRARKTLSV